MGKIDIAMNVGKMRDESYRNKIKEHSKNTQDFIHYRIEYTHQEKVSCSDGNTHPLVYYTVPKGGEACCQYCNRKWIRK
jgi:uncharacterized Zn-finger protein